MSFDHLGLTPELIRAVADQGYETPTPVQEQAIPLVLQGRDLLAAAQTGTGKTAAFVLPILQLINATRPQEPPAAANAPVFDQRGRRPMRPVPTRGPIHTLVLVPTRELAVQVEEQVRVYGAQRPVRSMTIFGGVGFDPQVRALRAGPAIVVATPGRLLDHVNQRTIDLSQVRILVLDEADRMLDMGFIQPIRTILALLPPRRQNLLFSATFSDDVRNLAGGLLNSPASVDVAVRNSAPELVDQLVLRVDRERKRELLSHLLLTRRIDQALVFTRTKHGANRLAQQLDDDGIAATAIHGNKSQAQRTRALADFKAGRALVLVATDIAARGIDIESLPHVVNYELPSVASDYVHRIGRTGRAGIDGQAISLVCVDEAPLLREIEALVRRPIPSEVVPGFEPDRSLRPEPIRLRSAVPVRSGFASRPNGMRLPFGARANVARPGGQPSGGRPSGGRPGGRPGGALHHGARPTAPGPSGPRRNGPWPVESSQNGPTRPNNPGRPTRPWSNDPRLNAAPSGPVESGTARPDADRRWSNDPRLNPDPRPFAARSGSVGRPTGSHPARRPGPAFERPAGVGFGNQPRPAHSLRPAHPAHSRGSRPSFGPNGHNRGNGRPNGAGRPAMMPGERFARPGAGEPGERTRD